MIPKVDLIVVSGVKNLSLSTIAVLYPKVVLVFDSSTPLWKIQLWKKEAERLHLRHHSVPEQGAFEFNL
jgi:competence protein ComEC